MAIAPITLNSIEEAIDRFCNDPIDLSMVQYYTGYFGREMSFNLEADYEEIELDEESDLRKAWINEKTLEMILVVENDLRIYKYKDKEMFKTDARILRKKSGQIKTVVG